MLKIVCFIAIFYYVKSSTLPNIAVVGGGIGGTSCAYFLRELFGEKVEISVYEKDVIGGRLNLLNVDGNYYEAGGAVIHPSNQHMLDFMKLLGLQSRKAMGGRFGIYNGEKFVFRESNWSFITIADFLWRYGFSGLELRNDVKNMINDFSSIYKLQKQQYAFTTVSSLLESMSPRFRNMTQESLLSHLTKKAYSKLLLEELVQSVMMVNYGQTNNISAFAGFVSLAGADNNLFSVEGGNKRVAEGLLQKANAVVIDGDVQQITLLSDSTFSLDYFDGSSSDIVTKKHDIVVVASPFVKDQKNIKFRYFHSDFSQHQRPYRRIISTFVLGQLNPVAFNNPDVPEEILTFKTDLPYNSIGKVQPVDSDKSREDVYKVFSHEFLPQKIVDALFENVQMVKEREWLAYPHYQPPEALPPFVLSDNLYYTNAIELSASAMEMSAIAGRNVALLAFNVWNKVVDKVDNHRILRKDEL